MLIKRYITSLLIMLTPVAAQAWEGVTDHQDIEMARGEIYPYNSDTLYVNNDVYSSLYVSRVDGWQQSAQCDTLYESKYIFPFEWLNREVILRVGYVDAPYTVEINGKPLARVNSGSSRFEFNVTNQTLEGMNKLALRLEPNSKSRAIEGWRESSDIAKNPIHNVEVISPAKMSVRDIIVDTYDANGEVNSRFGIVLKTYNLNQRFSTLRYKLRDSDGELVANGVESMKLRYRGEDTMYLTSRLDREQLWSGASPKAHTLDIELVHDHRVVERHRLKTGLRELSISDDGDVSINGKVVELRAMEVSGDISRSEIIDIRNNGVNTLIFKAGYEPVEALSICDELGLYAIVTAAIDSSKTGNTITVGGNVTNVPEWRDEYVDRLERGYYNLRRHPSVIAYNMASRSMNGYNLYEGYVCLKVLQSTLPVVNLDGGGEWNGDKLKLKMIKPY